MLGGLCGDIAIPTGLPTDEPWDQHRTKQEENREHPGKHPCEPLRRQCDGTKRNRESDFKDDEAGDARSLSRERL